jgi:hypothetical protein
MLQGADATVELAVGEEVGKVRAKVGIGEPEQVALATKAGPLREDGEGEDLAMGERKRTP